MQQDKQNLFEIVTLVILFVFLAAISFYHVEQSISVIKYHFQWAIRSLLDNYSLYHQSFQKFLFQTSAFHPGNSESEWHTVFYLLPLYIFCDLLGGLSLKAVCLFTVFTSLIFIGLFYWWVRGVWGKQDALFAAFFLGFSSVFQEFARSGSYDAYSLLIAMIWVLFLFRYDQQAGTIIYFVFGLLTGLTWYGYGILRCLTLAAMAHILFSKVHRKVLVMGVFLAGMMAILIPGFLIKLAVQRIDLAHYHDHLYLLFFDKEASFRQGSVESLVSTVFNNLRIFELRIFGGRQLIEPAIIDRTHAFFYNPLLVIPLFIGIRQVFKSGLQRANLSMFLLSLMIYLTPCLLTSSQGYLEARRSLLYVIPSYCFIGIGMRQMLDWIGMSSHHSLRRGMIFLIAGVIGVVLVSEMIFVKSYVLSSKRDVGLLSFAEKIKGSAYSGKMFYIDGRSIYIWTWESSIMRAALMENGRSPFDVSSGNINAPIPYTSKDFYVVAGSGISPEKFDDWCARNRLKSGFVFGSPVINSPFITTGKYFKLYTVHRVS